MTIKLLPETEKYDVTKEKVLEMERKFIEILDFDFQLLSPLTFLERFLRLANAENEEKIALVAKEMCFVARCKSEFNVYYPSQIAAASLIWALNLFHDEKVPSLKFWEDSLERYGL